MRYGFEVGIIGAAYVGTEGWVPFHEFTRTRRENSVNPAPKMRSTAMALILCNASSTFLICLVAHALQNVQDQGTSYTVLAGVETQ
jgi:hypothetical protein